MSTDLERLNELCAEADKAAREIVLKRQYLYSSFCVPPQLIDALLERTKPVTWDDLMVLRLAFEDAYEGILRASVWAKTDGKERVTFPATWWDAVKAHWLPRFPAWFCRWFASPRYKVIEMERYAIYPTIRMGGGSHIPLKMFDRREWFND